ncbi:MAG: DNA translocase FtsK 4TM domain-containing protein [Bacteroidales bacterium]|nr:DNA translocase FtsK 4TM domain-containing protein [Bacteroidales bacterium]MCB9012848.1 DNA translocase FtsK 4TM domain-containing protein [Bacteroidales bacterium]
MVKFFKAIIQFFRDERVKVVIGSFFILLSLYIAIAFISYLFTWRADQDFFWEKLFSGPEISVDNNAGKLGAWISAIFFNHWFGIASFIFPFMLFVTGISFFKIHVFKTWRTLRISLAGLILLSIILGYVFGMHNEYLGSGPGGGHGFYVSQWLNASLGKPGTGFLLLLLSLAFFIFSYAKTLPFLKKLFTRKEKSLDAEKAAEAEEKTEEKEVHIPEKEEIPDEEILPDEPEEEEILLPQEEGEIVLTVEKPDANDEIENPDAIEKDYDPTLDLSSYKYPPLSLLNDYESGTVSVSNEELISNKNKIVETLANYKITIDKIKATIGPTVTLYEIVPAPGIRISKIKSLEDDIALSLAALGIRIIAPIPGRGTIGIEVPNQKPKTVSMKSVLSSKKFQEEDYELPVALGKTISNETYVFDLTRMPHLLVAGATGQGKSVGLNAIITSLLYKKHPSQLKFVLVDPKKVELTLYAKIERHFLAKLPDTEEAIITDTQKVITTLNSLTKEMDDRYNLLKNAHVRNIKEYNEKFIKRKLNPEKGHRFLPYIVLVIDEFADLIMTAGREVENPIARLAQLARAIGIHLIIATQRPTTNIITGVIKANFPARVAFRVLSVVDSRTILDMSGANQLIGRGDMLISAGSDPVRIQCAFIDTPEIDSLTEFIGSQRAYPSAHILPEVEDVSSGKLDVDLKKRDAEFETAARLVVQYQQGSTSLIQRKLSLGYNRAGRIVDQLEAAGILGPFEGSKARDVLIQDEVSLEHILKSLE